MFLLLQLDDWVLCRVRHRGYSLKSLSENQENHCEPSIPVNLQKGEEHQTKPAFRADMITDYQYKDYQIIASILVGGVIPPTENMSNLSFKGMRSNNLTSVYEESFDKMNSQTTIPSLECYFNPLKRKCNEDDEQLENLISFNNKFNIENRIEKSPSIDFQKLNELTFAERYQQWSSLENDDRLQKFMWIIDLSLCVVMIISTCNIWRITRNRSFHVFMKFLVSYLAMISCKYDFYSSNRHMLFQ